MRASVRNLLVGAAATALVASSVAWAQTPPAAPPAAGQDFRAQRFERMCKEMPAWRAGRLAYLEVKLGITDQQRAAWNTYAQEMRTAGQPMQRLCSSPPKIEAQSDAAAVLAYHEQHLSARLEGIKAARAATEKLQAVLTPEQKTTLAEATRHGMRGMRGHRHHHAQGHMHHRGPAPAGTPPAGGPAPR